jgi:hypothetical protein
MDNKNITAEKTYKEIYVEVGVRNGYPAEWLKSQFGTMDFEIQELAAEEYASLRSEQDKKEYRSIHNETIAKILFSRFLP